MPTPISGAQAVSTTLPTAPRTSSAGPIQTETATIDPALLEAPDSFDQDMFLKLLVAQLKYQNPLDPMDSSDFMAQSAQFTTVEKLQELTSTLGQALANDRMSAATGMIGRDITFTRADGTTATATVTSIRVQLNGPMLITNAADEVGMADVQQISARP